MKGVRGSIFCFSIDGTSHHAWPGVEFSFSAALKCRLCFKTPRCAWTLRSMVVLPVHFIWKSISDMKYLYMGNHINNLVFAGVMAFDEVSSYFSKCVELLRRKDFCHWKGRVPPGAAA